MKTVTVIGYGRTTVEMILVKEMGNVFIVTTREEWEAARKEARAPVTVGFRREYVVNEISP